jgi:hypothetical protein
MPVTSDRRRRPYGGVSQTHRQEVAVTTLMKKTSSRMARWFSKLSEQKKSRTRWYDVDCCGM